MQKGFWKRIKRKCRTGHHVTETGSVSYGDLEVDEVLLLQAGDAGSCDILSHQFGHRVLLQLEVAFAILAQLHRTPGGKLTHVWLSVFVILFFIIKHLLSVFERRDCQSA